VSVGISRRLDAPADLPAGSNWFALRITLQDMETRQ
jgi:hypothetical protein